MELGALEPDGEGLVAAMVEDGDKVAGAAVMDGAANGPCTDRRFALDDKEAEAVPGGTSVVPSRDTRSWWRRGGDPFHRMRERALPPRRTKYEVLHRRRTGVVEVDPFVFDQTHGDGWPVGFRASEQVG